MDRKPLREFTHKVENFLTINNNAYKQWVFRYTFLELEKDLGNKGDITTNSIFKTNRQAKAQIVAKQDGIFAGLEEIKYFLIDADPNFRPSIKGKFEIDFKIKDGEEFKKGDVLMEISGEIHDMLAVERVVLNLIMRMSSVATFARKIVDMVAEYDVLVTPTRKTLWGLLDKRAVIIGGGGTHRINLNDAILVKDNHLALIDHDYEAVLQRIYESKVDCRFIEIEVDSVERVIRAAEAFYEFLGDKIRSIGVLLMDNMGHEMISEAMKKIKEKNLYDKILFEASGGITEKNVVEYAKTGVDIISMGCLTSGVSEVDLNMRV